MKIIRFIQKDEEKYFIIFEEDTEKFIKYNKAKAKLHTGNITYKHSCENTIFFSKNIDFSNINTFYWNSFTF